MLDIGWQELFIIAVLALIVVGPKDLPQALRVVTGVVRKARGLAREFQNGLDEMVREAELDDIKRQVQDVGRIDVEREIKDTVDPTGSLSEEFDPAEFARDLKDRVEGGPPTGPMAKPEAEPMEETPPAPLETEPAKTATEKTATQAKGGAKKPRAKTAAKKPAARKAPAAKAPKPKASAAKSPPTPPAAKDAP